MKIIKSMFGFEKQKPDELSSSKSQLSLEKKCHKQKSNHKQNLNKSKANKSRSTCQSRPPDKNSIHNDCSSRKYTSRRIHQKSKDISQTGVVGMFDSPEVIELDKIKR